MKNFNIEFKGKKNWQKFVLTNNLMHENNILIQVFSSIECPLKLKTLVESIEQELPLAIIIGCTSDGAIFEQRVVSSEHTLLIISVFEHTKIIAKHWPLTDDHIKVGELAAKSLVQSDSKAMIAFADGLKANGEDLLNGFNRIAPTIPVAGGLSGDNWKFKQTYIIHQSNILENALVVVVLNSDNLHVNSDYLFEWKPVGKQMRVTKAVKNHLLEIDNKPVQDIYRHYLGLNDDDDFMTCAAEFPLMILRDNMELARCPLAIGEDGSIYFAGNFTVNDQVQFCYAHSHHIQKAHNLSMQRMFSKPVEAVYIYNCAARKHFIPEQVNNEIKQYQQFGDVGGVFLYGEFFHRQNKHAFLNHSLTALYLSESRNGKQQIKSEKVQGISENNTMNRLFNLIEATSEELNHLNLQLSEQVTENTKQIIEQQQRLQQAQKMEAIGELTGGIAHDFNNILVSIIGYSQLASEQFSSENKQLAHYLNTINKAGERARDLIANMLAFSRHNSRKPETVEICNVFSETLALLTPAIPSSIDLTFNLQKDISPLIIDPTQFQQVMMNLVINARDALSGKGKINVVLKVVYDTGHYCHSCHQSFSGSFLVLSVTDNGSGISQQDLSRIFEPFFTTKASEKGSGMGLSVIHGIVHAHNGHIRVHSTANQETKFSLYFPYQEDILVNKIEKEDKKHENFSAVKGKNILIVDDEPLILKFLSTYLSYHDFNVITASNGQLALEKIHELSIDLLVTDQTMPEMTGLELCREVKRFSPKMPVIVSSGYSEDIGAHNIDKFGIDHFHAKPSSPVELLTAIIKLLSRD